MKNKFLILFLMFLVVGCTKEKENPVQVNSNQNDNYEVVDTYVDDNPIKVGLYLDGKLVDEYNTTLVNRKDIVSFDVYFTNEADVGSGDTKDNFMKYYNMYQDIDDYKIGFYISFDTVDRKMEKVILDPSAMHELNNIYNYLYDDVHQDDGAWYSHVTEEEVNDDTIYSSIKLYACREVEDIVSPITLMVFTYNDEDDFDGEGYYRGNSSHTVIINNK